MQRVVLFLFVLVPAAAIAQTRADMQCKAAGKDLIYNCVIRLARADQPVSGAQLTVEPDMPSMPEAHKLKPVKGRPGKGPGEYLVRLDLHIPAAAALRVRVRAAWR